MPAPCRRLHAPAVIAAGCFAAVLAPMMPARAQPVPQPAMAPQVALQTALFVEHTKLSHGETVRSLSPADRLAHGDRVVTYVTWYRLGGRGGFTVTNPLPAGLVWQGSADAHEQVSVDGGRTWGRLGQLRVGARPAIAADVTHVRWHVGEDEAETGSGAITYAGLVR